MQYLEKLYGLIGSFMCHQLPSRTIFLEGRPLPVCARDTGIYIGIFTAMLYIAARRRFAADKPPAVFPAVLLCSLMLPMMLDGVSSYAGFRASSNGLRLYTGVLFGISLPVFLVPAANFKIRERNTRDIIGSWYEIPLLAALGLISSTVLAGTGFIPWVLTASIIILTFIFFIGRIMYTLVARMNISRYRGLFVFCLTSGFFCVMALLSNFVLQPLKSILLER